MVLQNKILKAIKEGLATAFNFDDITDALLDDIKTEPIKNSAKSVKHRWLYPKLAQLISDVLNNNESTLTLDEQNTLFEDCVKCGVYYQFPDNETFKTFIQNYRNINRKANLNWIDTSNITNMSGMFFNSSFDGDISAWNVSNVTDMSWMFYWSKFDGDISKWDVSSVTNMSWMFEKSKFNRDISSWDVSCVTDMGWMFYNSDFNRDISEWDVSNVTNMSKMFYNSAFNRDISSWNVSSDTDTYDIFYKCPIKEEYKPIL